jgi:hypothetical protein
MKKIVILALLMIMSACTPEDGPIYHYEVLPVESFEVPEEFVLGQIFQINVSYLRPSTCHYEHGIYWERHSNTRIIGIQSLVETRDNCISLEDEATLHEKTFDFHVTGNGPYLFRFFKGKDEEGNLIFEDIEIPVAED